MSDCIFITSSKFSVESLKLIEIDNSGIRFGDTPILTGINTLKNMKSLDAPWPPLATSKDQFDNHMRNARLVVLLEYDFSNKEINESLNQQYLPNPNVVKLVIGTDKTTTCSRLRSLYVPCLDFPDDFHNIIVCSKSEVESKDEMTFYALELFLMKSRA